MKEKEKTMESTRAKPRFDALELALEVVAVLADGPFEAIRRKDKNLADQLDRASTSAVLNLAEGSRRRGRDRAHFYAIADGSREESRLAIRVAAAKRLISGIDAAKVDALMDRHAAVMFRLLRARS